jgi:hypothetical protein
MAEAQNIKLDFDYYLFLLDMVGEAVKLQVKDVQDFIKMVDIEIALDNYMRNPDDKSPLLAILLLQLLAHQQIISFN